MVEVWKQLICQTCGSNDVEIVDGILCCKVCKSKHTLQEKISEEEVISLNVAAADRNAYKFEDALERYEQLLQKYPDNEAANWGALLADYGIAYVKDYDEKLVPTCHRLSERPIAVCPYYYKLNADHKARAEEIEKLRVAIMEKANKIPPYDVFICYKATEDVFGRSVPTKEAGWAREIYTMLKHKLNLRVFFAEESLTGENSEWEPHIYKALNTAKLMFVLTTGKENVHAVWVKNEWKRFSHYIKEGQDKTIRVVYDAMNAYDLPKELQDTQAINHNTMGWGDAVRKAAEAIFVVKQETPEWQKAMEEMQAKMNANAENGVAIADKYCAKCYAPHAKHIKFCGECGNKEFIVAPDGVKYCLDCGTANQIKQNFCNSCGKSKFVYTKEEYQKEVERKERERKAEEERKERERLAAEERARKEAERKERERLAAEERAKKTKKIISIVAPILAVIIVIVSTMIGINEKARNGLTMELSADDSYYIVTDCPEDKTEVVIPDSYWGKPVKVIGYSAFEDCSSLTSITIPNSVTSIGSSAFRNCISLTSVSCPAYAISYIPKGNLKTVIITSGESIGSYTFRNCISLTSITIPDSVTSIGDYVFRNCSSLASITIPNSVTSIGNGAFYNCSSLTEITLPFVGATKDGTDNTHFGYIFGASNYSSNDSYVPTSLKKVTITSATSIGKGAFQYCNNLTSIIIPDSVTSIGKYAFYGCSSLTNITIPDSVTSIGAEAFFRCGSLTSITIPDGVTSIGAHAFGKCSSLTSVVIPDSVTSIGNCAFWSCSSLTSVVIGNSVTSIGAEAFFICGSLTSITIPDSVTSIGDNTFSECGNLMSINFDGTKAQWKAISKGNGWAFNVPATYVQCTDGTVSI